MRFFDKENTIAGPGFNRWLVPPAALSIHLCIGQIYAYSVFNDQLTRVVMSESHPMPWKLSQLGWIFSLAIVFLGASAAIFGKWVERSGPRKAMFASAVFFAGGFFVAALGVYMQQLWLIYLGHGVLGGIGLGLGYISPVSTLVKWFPDKPGMATGLAIMGFGGGAMIASPLSSSLMKAFALSETCGVGEAFLIMGGLYFVFMMLGVFIVRIPADGWIPEGYDPAKVSKSKMVTSAQVAVSNAVKTPQFYLLFAVLLLNVSAGIGVLGQAKVMIKEMFSETAVGSAKAVGETAAVGFVGLLSLFNMAGRFGWSSLSDIIGRKNTYSVFFVLGAILYFLVPLAGGMGSVVLFVAAFAIIMSMYGGGFATIPAYLKDMFGTMNVGAIHGRLLLAWSTAGVLGPVLINYLREYQIEELGLPKAQAYSFTMYIMAGLLVIGLVANLLVKPVDPRFHHHESQTES